MHTPKKEHKMAPIILQHNTYKEHAVLSSTKENAADMMKEKFKEEDDDEDLFEIDLEAVGNLPPPYYWESYLTATTNTLFANCLVPKADVSSAVPMGNPKQTLLGRFIWVQGAEPLQNICGVSSPAGALSNLLQKTLNVSSSLNQGK